MGVVGAATGAGTFGWSPFVHPFETSQSKYLYDVNTRRILRVNPVVWDIVADVGVLPDQDVIAKHRHRHLDSAIADGIGHIRRAQQAGQLLGRRPRLVKPPSAERVLEQVRNGRQQLILNVTNTCNFRCSYCIFGGDYDNFRTHDTKTMEWGVARAAVDDFVKHSRAADDPVISFYGGEPLLSLRLMRECVDYVLSLRLPKIRFAITTNGWLLNRDAGDFLAANSFSIVVSLDGPQRMHDENRRTADGQPTWQQVMGSLAVFLQRHPEYRENGRLRFNTVLTPASSLVELRHFYDEHPVFTDAMGVEVGLRRAADDAPLNPSDMVCITRNLLQKEFLSSLRSGEFGESFTKRKRWLQQSLFGVALAKLHKRGYRAAGLPEEVPLLSTCIPAARRTFVTTDGTYLVCERVEHSGAFQIGHVSSGVDEQKVLELLQTWNNLTSDHCRSCWCIGTCGVGCFATVTCGGHLDRDAKLAACARHRREAHQLLVQYAEILEQNPNAFDYTRNMAFS